MPVYSYCCSQGHSCELFRHLSDPEPTHCPECGAQLARIWTPFAIRFTGPGFYNTDYGRSQRSKV